MSIVYSDLADPVTPSPLFAAVAWIEHMALGSLATSIAVIAVAVVGLMMLRGRLQVQRGAIVILGCFVLFGAPVLAAGIRGIGSSMLPPSSPARASPTPSSVALPMPTASSNYDPYAGASVPR
ncbi:TrbC/VirB2 family protein [Sphingomonas sp. MMS12-HWE2-04]|uniref:TrbC/VirB2 family protein n=1 Tax=Sphingomonas sp. MMS12-HWE2-04 TaxID=3234199 RepID=UPI00384C3E5F